MSKEYIISVPNDAGFVEYSYISGGRKYNTHYAYRSMERLVRCGECKHWSNGDDVYGICFRCSNTRQMKTDDFCSYGVKRGANDAPTIEIVAHGNCARCGKPIEGNSIFLCDKCKSQIDCRTCRHNENKNGWYEEGSLSCGRCCGPNFKFYEPKDESQEKE